MSIYIMQQNTLSYYYVIDSYTYTCVYADNSNSYQQANRKKKFSECKYINRVSTSIISTAFRKKSTYSEVPFYCRALYTSTVVCET